MSAYAFTALFNAFVSLIFGLWVFATNPRHSINRRWLILNIFIATWTFCQFMREMSTTPQAAMFWGGYGIYLSSTMLPVLYLHFITEFIGRPLRLPRWLLPAGYASSLAIVVLLTTSDLILTGMKANPFFRYYVDPGKLYFLYLLHFAGLFLVSFIYMFLGVRRTTGLRRDQLRIMIGALFITVLGGSTSFLPVLGVNVFPFGNYFVSLYIFIYSYLVVKHQWLDINLFLRKSLSAILVVLTFVIPLFILTVLAQNYFFHLVNPVFTVLVLAAMVIAVLTIPRLTTKAEETIEQILFPGRRDDRRTIARFSHEAVSILDLSKLLQGLVTVLSKNFQVTKVAVLVLDEKREKYRIQESLGFGHDYTERVFLNLHSPWVSRFQKNPETLYREVTSPPGEEPPRNEIFDLFGAELVIPLVVKSRLVGIFLLGERERDLPYSLDDLELLRTLANQAAIAIENARLYADLKRSRQYIRRADRLASLGTLAAGLAHEIRNPLVSIKTFIQLLPQRIDDPDFLTSFLSIANDEVERIRRLVEELLNFARPSEPNLQLSDLNEIVEKTLLLVENDLKSKGIQISHTLDRELPEVLVDKEQIKQVVLNIVLNAIQAVGQGGHIRVETRTVGLSGHKPSVQVEIYDNGPGILEEDVEHIFNPFYTTKHMGSGLGLAISHQIIKEHHGSIDVESTPGKGSIFFINLPLDPRKHERRRYDGE